MKQIKIISTEFNHQIEFQTNEYLRDLDASNVVVHNVEIRMYKQCVENDSQILNFHSIITIEVSNDSVV